MRGFMLLALVLGGCWTPADERGGPRVVRQAPVAAANKVRLITTPDKACKFIQSVDGWAFWSYGGAKENAKEKAAGLGANAVVQTSGDYMNNSVSMDAYKCPD